MAGWIGSFFFKHILLPCRLATSCTHRFWVVVSLDESMEKGLPLGNLLQFCMHGSQLTDIYCPPTRDIVTCLWVLFLLSQHLVRLFCLLFPNDLRSSSWWTRCCATRGNRVRYFFESPVLNAPGNYVAVTGGDRLQD